MIDPHSDDYLGLKISLALDFAPRIYPCKKCGHPVANGYCCRGCGSDDPSSEVKSDGE